MKFLFFLIIILSTLCHSLPPYKDRRSDSGQPWVRRTRSNPPSQDTLNNKRGTTVLGFKIKIPKFIRSMSISVKEFFFGPSGVVTKVKDFLSGNSKVSTRVFGTKIDFQANVPLSKEDVGKSFSSFLRKFRTDPMTRVLFVMYLNVVVIIVVFMVLLAKHVQISLQAMRDSRDKKAFFPTPVASHIRTVSPDVAMPEAPQMRRPSPESEGILPEDDTQSSSDESRTIDWSAVANPSLLNVVNQDTLVTTHKPPRLLNDLEGLLSPSKEDKEPPTGSVHRSNSNSSGEGPNALSPKQSFSNNSQQGSQFPTRSSNYFTALESRRSSFDASLSQGVPSKAESIEE